MVFQVDGTDLRDYLVPGGFSWRRKDVEGRNSGDAQDGAHIRDRLRIREVLDIKLRPLTTGEAAVVLAAIEPDYVQVSYNSPRAGGTVTKTMYVEEAPASHLTEQPGTGDWWEGLNFRLIEK